MPIASGVIICECECNLAVQWKIIGLFKMSLKHNHWEDFSFIKQDFGPMMCWSGWGFPSQKEKNVKLSAKYWRDWCDTVRLVFIVFYIILQVMKTYHMYHTESISAESKLKEAEKQEEKQFSKSGDLNVNLLRHEDRPQRRSSVRKIEKMKEKVRLLWRARSRAHNARHNATLLLLNQRAVAA